MQRRGLMTTEQRSYYPIRKTIRLYGNGRKNFIKFSPSNPQKPRLWYDSCIYSRWKAFIWRNGDESLSDWHSAPDMRW